MARLQKETFSVALASVGVCLLFACSASAENPTTKQETTAGPLTVSSITSVFVAAKLATQYSVDVTDANTINGKKPSFSWSLSLHLVDPAGSSPPGNSDSHAAVDNACDNAQLPGGSKFDLGSHGPKYVITWDKLREDFTWFHGDKGAYAPSPYGCDHKKMGPSGHQGTVSVAVTSGDEKWRCYASIDGSNLSPTPVYSSAPTCTNLVRQHLELLAHEVGYDIGRERDAADEIGTDNASAKNKLKGLAESLQTIAKAVKGDGGKSDTVDEIEHAARLDADAAKEDLETKAGRQKALDDIAAALKLKKKAMAEVERLAAAQPTR